MKNSVATLAMVVGALLIGSQWASVSKSEDDPFAPRPQWEYKVLSGKNVQDLMRENEERDVAVERIFNDFGKEGWEITVAQNGTIVFKRLRR